MHTRSCIVISAVVAAMTMAHFAMAVPITADQLQLPDSPASRLQSAGIEALQKNSFDIAESNFRAATKADPKAPAPLLGLAEIALLRGDAKSAQTKIDQALAIAPSSSIAHTYKGRYLSGQRDYQGAISEFDKAIKLDPSAVDPLVAKADVLGFALNNKKDATEIYQTAIRLNSKSARAHFGLGSLLLETSQFSNARAEFVQVTQLAPEDGAAWLSLGAVQAKLNDLNAALASFDKAAKLDYGSAEPYLGRGDVFSAQGKGEEAIAAYSDALKIEPRATTALIRRGLVKERLNRTVEAEKDYRAAIELDANNPLAANNLAYLLAEQKRSLNDALAFAKKAVAAAPKNSDFLDTLAWVYRARNELPLALETLLPLANNTKDPGLLVHLGTIYAEMGKKKEAIATFDRALELAPDFKPARDARLKISGA